MNFINDLLLFDSSVNIYAILIRVLLAVLFGGIIGIERGKHGSQAGLRTHILVCLGATMSSLVGVYSAEIFGFGGDPLRVAAQVVSGIGFLGAGMIMIKNNNFIVGLTTAAGIWATANIGIALGMGFYAGASLIMIACVFTTTFLTRIERKRRNSLKIYAEIEELSLTGSVTDRIRNELHNNCTIELVTPRSNTKETVGLHIVITEYEDPIQTRCEIEEIEGVTFAVIE